METVFKQNKSNLERSILAKRLTKLQSTMKRVDNHYIYQDGLNFNFLYSLYSQKLEYLLNEMGNISETEFQEKLLMLNRSVQEIKSYIIK